MAARAAPSNLVEVLLITGGLGFLAVRYVLPRLGVQVALPILPPVNIPDLVPPPAAPGPAGAPRGIRNNNPGNVRWSLLNPWQGQIGKDAAGYAMFSSPEYGIRATLITLRNYINLHGLKTIKAIAGRWAPDGDGNNNSAVWASNVAIRSGIGQNALLDPNSAAQMQQLVRGVFGQENGGPYAAYYPAATLARAWSMI